MPDSREAPWDSQPHVSLGTRCVGEQVSPSTEPGVRVWT